MELAVAKKVKGEVMTASGREEARVAEVLSPMPAAARASQRASVPLAQPMACAEAVAWAAAISKVSTVGPRMKCCESQTWAMASSSSCRKPAYWREKSSMGMGGGEEAGTNAMLQRTLPGSAGDMGNRTHRHTVYALEEYIMRRNSLISPFAFSAAVWLGLIVVAGVSASAQSFGMRPCGGDKSSSGFLGHWFKQERACEVRSATFPLSGGYVRVHGFNGNVEVVGEDRADIALEARVQVQASSQDEARSLMRDVRLQTDGTISAIGPKTGNGKDWSVSFRLRVPRRVNAEIQTVNGELKLATLEGEISGRTTNGGLSLNDLAGDVRASTTNGEVKVVLTGRNVAGSRAFGALHKRGDATS